ncbi:uncharacterized protein K02A2.6-like [Saccostrea cucullata]|uniref:uncharacterized protein K02A2.6-like n=1 Tax=Saccostrea cuccullata TaxID=36930 RepID=UPI002ED31283
MNMRPKWSVGLSGALHQAPADLSHQDPLLHQHGSQPTANRLLHLVASYDKQGGARDLFLSPRVPTGVHFRVYVLKNSNSGSNLLSRSVAHRMELVMKIEEIRDVFGTHGCVKGPPVKITLKQGATPYCVTTARRIPFPLMPKVEAELNRLENAGIIAKVTEPTDWCAPIVTAFKKNGDVRLCVDLKKLNQAVKREHYMLPNLDDIAPKLCKATVFSKLDASSGFHQIPLDPESCHLTTFITPFGRYCFQRVPFGITSAPEIFQRRMSEILADITGADAIMDDIIIYGSTVEEHDERLDRVLDRIKEVGLKLNKKKCEFRKQSIEYFGHMISSDGISPCPERVRAIRELAAPTNVTELKRILGMVNYLGRFLPNLSTVMHPLTDLLKSDSVWIWDNPQEEAFKRVKDMLTETHALAFYSSSKPVVISADASSYGLGAAIFQQFDGQLKPIAFASRTLSPAETKYAQIEKECLASVWACEKFERYIIGLDSFKLITDHKPLVPLINTQALDKTPVRCQRLLMRLRRFNPMAEHVPGKNLVVPDTLSRSPLTGNAEDTEEEVNLYVDCVIQNIPISDQRLECIRLATADDPELSEVLKKTQNWWPDHERSLKAEIRPYFSVRSELSVWKGILMYRDRIVIPEALRPETLQDIHSGHLGLNKCRERARGANREPLKTTILPDRQWQKIVADLCELQGRHFLVVTDYFSRYLEIAYLDSLTSAHVIGKLENILARWGIPEELVADNGTQFTSDAFKKFAAKYGFAHTTTSPHYPQANGEAESAVKTAKRILQQDDIFIALMAYRSTPISTTGASPAELIMGRRIRTVVPVKPSSLAPKWPDLDQVRRQDAQTKETSKYHYDNRYGVRKLHPLGPGDQVRIKTDKEKQWTDSGTITSTNYKIRSYLVETDHGILRRNRRHLQHTGYVNTELPHTNNELLSESDDEGITNFEMLQAVTSCVGDAVKCIQLDRDLWRIYLTNAHSRSKILLEGFDFKNQHISPYDTNPYSAGLEGPRDQALKVTICGVPLSVDDSAIHEMLNKLGVSPKSDLKYEKIRNPTNNKMTNVLNGNRFINSGPTSGKNNKNE